MTIQTGEQDAQGGPTPLSSPPTHGTDRALRITVAGDGGDLDLAVPFGATAETVAQVYADRVGLLVSPRLCRPGGRELSPDEDVDDVVGQGALLLALTDEAPGLSDEGRHDDAASHPRSQTAARVMLGGTGALAAVAAGVAARGEALTGATWPVAVTAVLMLLGGLVIALRVALTGGVGEADPAGGSAYVVAPALAGAGGFTAAFTPDEGGLLLGLAGAGLAAATVAALARTGAEGAAEHLLRAWIIAAGLVAGVAAAGLLLGSSPLALAAVCFGVAVVVTRMLPGMAVDVDDDVLLDLDRLAVTAWSARETPRGGRRRHQVRTAMVDETVARSRRTLTAAVTATASVCALAGPVVVLGLGGTMTTWASWGGLAMVALGAAALGLVARSFRLPWPRRMLAATAVWLVLVASAGLVARLEPGPLWWVFGVVVTVTPLVVLTAVQLGRGWRSIWWARAGEILETLTGVLVLALLPLASGLFDLVRTSFS